MLRLIFRNVFGMILVTGNVILVTETIPVLRSEYDKASRVDRVL